MATITASSQSLFLLHPKTPFLSLSKPTRKTLFFATCAATTTNLSLQIRASSSSSTPAPSISSIPTLPFNNSPLSTSMRPITTLITTIFSVSKLFATKIASILPSPTPNELQNLSNLRKNLLCSVGPLFFAALKDRPSGSLNTPLTVVAAGMAKWLDIYSGVLMVRVLLSWFPNIPWDRQPLSAIRDLCDPYLNLFRNIIPPIFDTLDVSPLLAFAVLGLLGSILNSSLGSY
ncbi:ylmG homolog protein 1-2, chloroplastic-like [Chenopodium quinoa]|uniref:Uncharacterized protein n=1 Tax=Chenopodium quinoa TaxID=63459 RepID=A0A803LTF5_CHEQI|nr:ylmG homolog protein 1-2, chloroplastic-like [Chenopodium quinoa]